MYDSHIVLGSPNFMIIERSKLFHSEGQIFYYYVIKEKQNISKKYSKKTHYSLYIFAILYHSFIK